MLQTVKTFFKRSVIVSNKKYVKVKAENKLCLQKAMRLRRQAWAFSDGGGKKELKNSSSLNTGVRKIYIFLHIFWHNVLNYLYLGSFQYNFSILYIQ